MKRLILALAILCASHAFAAETVTVDEAVAIALEHNANVKNAQLEIQKGEERVAAMRTKRLPQFTLSAIGGETLTNLSIEVDNGPTGEKTRVDLGRTFNTLGVARITQPLTQLHAIGLGIKLNEAALAASKEQERAARLAITREVKSAYYAVLSARAYAEAMKEAVAAAEEVDREMNVRVAQKAVLEADHLDATARLAATRVTALSASNALASAKDRLNYLAGQELEPGEALVEDRHSCLSGTDKSVCPTLTARRMRAGDSRCRRRKCGR
jgi:outer membrane protein TolC